MTPDALLLDFDGTLIDWIAAMEVGVRAASVEFARLHEVDEAEVVATTLAFEAEVFESHATGWNLGGVGVAELHGAIWRRALDEYGLDPDTAAQLAEVHWSSELAAFRAYDDVSALLAATAEAGIRTALVTNGPSEVQRAKLEMVGLTDAFDAVLISAEVGAAKPDQAIFQAALAALDADPARTWHVGDSLEFDVAGAQAAGIKGVWINRPGWPHGRHQPQPSRVIEGLGELTRLIARAA